MIDHEACVRHAPRAHNRRQPFGLFSSIVALSVVGTTLGLFVTRVGSTAVPAAMASSSSHAKLAPAADGHAQTVFGRFALNALLVTLLDDSEPPRWTDVALRHVCGPATEVEIDGKPLLPGSPIPATAFTVRWQIDQCWPLEYSAVELSGIVELQVFHEDIGLGAIVDGRALRVSSAKGASRFELPFAASMELASNGRQ